MAVDLTTEKTLGFLSVLEHEALGLFGGFLLLNLNGRPVEFHCTAPLKASRAQRILFGPTLESYLYGEQIGATLVQKAGLAPLAVLVDRPAVLTVRPHIGLPTALVHGKAEGSAAGESGFMVGLHRFCTAARYEADRELIAERLAAVDELFDLTEPFTRIREAIEEAHRISSKAA